MPQTITEQGLRELLLTTPQEWQSYFGAHQPLGGVALMGAGLSHFGQEELGKSTDEEPDAMRMVVTLAIAGAGNAMNGALLGINGVGKSDLVEKAPLIIAGTKPKNIAFVPHRANLTEEQLLGNKEAYKIRRVNDGGESNEYVSGEQLAIINPDTTSIIFDELDYTSPTALAAARRVFQRGSIEVYTEEGPRQLSPVDLILSSFNTYGSIYGNVIEPATVSRIALAVEMGRSQQTVIARMLDKHKNLRDLQRPTIEPVISRENLEFMRSQISNVEMSNQVKSLMKLMIDEIDATLTQHDIKMGGPRIAEQLIVASKAVALRSGHTEVQSVDVFEVAEYMLTAKLGCYGKGNPLSGSGDPNSLESLVYEPLSKVLDIFQSWSPKQVKRAK
ncbi:MAG: hypothetical protein ACYCPS_04440 [Candidatus Saccharimonadales bacterium]